MIEEGINNQQELPNFTVTPQSYSCTVTVDCAVFGFQDGILKLLLVKRSVEPFKNMWMLPGGLMEENQSLEDAAHHVLFNLTDIHDLHYEQVKCYGDIGRHPVKRVMTVCFYALIKPENHPIIAKKYVSEVRWFSIDEIPELGFDHGRLWADAIEKLKVNLRENLLFGELLPRQFTLKELQDLYESILGQKFDRRNFRKKILQHDLIKSTGKKKKGVKGGPELFEMKQ